jgi:hypothetical protein
MAHIVKDYLAKDIPIVAVCNISETFYEFLSRADNPEQQSHLIAGEQYRGDRALVWLGDPKLVFVSYPIPHAAYLCEQFGYEGTAYMAPSSPSPWLSLDILREPALLNGIVEYAGPARTIQLIPYATTLQLFQLAETLRSQYGLTVLMPESPEVEDFWLRDYIDTKHGFRAQAARWLINAKDLLLEGASCTTRQQAAEVAYWFSLQDKSCILKADIGENGLGNYIISPGHYGTVDEIIAEIDRQPMLRSDWITVEEYKASTKRISPSLELFVPARGVAEPRITYLCNQIFLDSLGDFCGVLISKEHRQTSWYPVLAESGLLIAHELQEMGYVGHFDLDAIVDDDDTVFLVEINSRRTGGTHVHEFAEKFFGPDYLEHRALLSYDAMKSGSISQFDELMAAVGDLAYPMQGQPCGVIITITSALVDHEFGCIVVAETGAEAIAIQQALSEQIHMVAVRQ